MKLSVIVTATRPGRKGLAIGEWFADRAAAHPDVSEVQLLDLAKIDLPILDEPNHPRLERYVNDHTKAWSRLIDQSDAFVFILPEYNHAAPPAFFNCVDYLSREWGYKPAGIVSYGGVSGGLRAAQTAKPVLATVKVVPLVEQVVITMVAEHFGDGKFEATERHDAGADTMLTELARWSAALSTLR